MVSGHISKSNYDFCKALVLAIKQIADGRASQPENTSKSAKSSRKGNFHGFIFCIDHERAI